MITEPKLPWGVELVRRESVDFIGWETVGRVLVTATQLTTDIENDAAISDLDRNDRLRVMRKLKDGLARSLAETETFLRWMEEAEVNLYGKET